MRDRGAGIPAARRDRALRRFGRLDSSLQLPGTGLGLAFVAAIAELHGAGLRLEEPGPGLGFVPSLPPAASGSRSS